MEYQKGDIVAAIVTGITNYGIFVQMDEDSSGLIHISEISDNYVRNVERFAQLGEVIRVKVLENLGSGKYCLSIKGIDYRILSNRKSKIRETKLGFSNLALALEGWIKETCSQEEEKS